MTDTLSFRGNTQTSARPGTLSKLTDDREDPLRKCLYRNSMTANESHMQTKQERQEPEMERDPVPEYSIADNVKNEVT